MALFQAWFWAGQKDDRNYMVRTTYTAQPISAFIRSDVGIHRARCRHSPGPIYSPGKCIDNPL